jgi:hypothetical protein
MDGSSRCGVHGRPRYGTSMPGVGAIHPIKRTRLPAGGRGIRTLGPPWGEHFFETGPEPGDDKPAGS